MQRAWLTKARASGNPDIKRLLEVREDCFNRGIDTTFIAREIRRLLKRDK
jgi:hypothetical protein